LFPITCYESEKYGLRGWGGEGGGGGLYGPLAHILALITEN